MFKKMLLLALLIPLIFTHLTTAQTPDPRFYDIGSPGLTEIWVDPVNGNDGNSGTAVDQALQTVNEAWNRIPQGTELTTGYYIWLAAGVYPPENLPNYWEARYGTFAAPIMLEAAQPGVIFPSVNIFDTRYLYFIGMTFQSENDPFHCERCDHLLLRNVTISGAISSTQEGVKINQSQYVYIENSDISGAGDNAIDFVAVQYGHLQGNKIHGSGDWCLYLKGGSAYFRVESNEVYDCGTGGFTAGQGTGFEYMVAPWLHYEAYDIKFINNIVHDVNGAGAGVNGGYNILIAYNTFYNVGAVSHVIEVVFGLRTCDGDTDQCAANNAQGGWGPVTVGVEEPIPNRNVYLYNNLVYNPPGTQSKWQHFAIYAPRTPSDGSNIPSPAVTDENLQIRGNVIWNGSPEMPLGIEADAGCQNATCNADQLRAENVINTLVPQLTDPANGNFVPLSDGNLFGTAAYPIPDFMWEDATPAGNISNAVSGDFAGQPRSENSIPGALAGTSAAVAPQATAPLVPPAASPAEGGLTCSSEPLPPGAITLVTVGDSLTEGDGDELERGGYPGRLIEMIQAVRPSSTLLNLGKSGWNSDALINGDQGLPGQLPQAVSALNTGQPGIALVWIGSNDLFYLYEYNNPDASGEQDDAAHYAANLDQILSQLCATGARVIIAQLDDQSLRPVTQGMEAFTGISAEEVQRMSQQVTVYNAIIAEKAAQYGALMVDFYHTTIFTDPATLAGDGNHPNAAGQDISAQIWFEALRPLLGE